MGQLTSPESAEQAETNIVVYSVDDSEITDTTDPKVAEVYGKLMQRRVLGIMPQGTLISLDEIDRLRTPSVNDSETENEILAFYYTKPTAKKAVTPKMQTSPQK